MKKIALKITLLFVAAFSFAGCSEVHDIAFPLDRTLWVTENYGNNDYYIKFNTITFTIYNNNTGIAVDSGTYEYVYDYPYDMVYLLGLIDDYTLKYDSYTDTLYDLSYGYTYQRGTYSDLFLDINLVLSSYLIGQHYFFREKLELPFIYELGDI